MRPWNLGLVHKSCFSTNVWSKIEIQDGGRFRLEYLLPVVISVVYYLSGWSSIVARWRFWSHGVLGLCYTTACQIWRQSDCSWPSYSVSNIFQYGGRPPYCLYIFGISDHRRSWLGGPKSPIKFRDNRMLRYVNIVLWLVSVAWKCPTMPCVTNPLVGVVFGCFNPSKFRVFVQIPPQKTHQWPHAVGNDASFEPQLVKVREKG